MRLIIFFMMFMSMSAIADDMMVRCYIEVNGVTKHMDIPATRFRADSGLAFFSPDDSSRLIRTSPSMQCIAIPTDMKSLLIDTNEPTDLKKLR